MSWCSNLFFNSIDYFTFFICWYYFLCTIKTFVIVLIIICSLGNAGCLPTLLINQNISHLNNDMVLGINIDSAYAPSADGSDQLESSNNDDYNGDERRLRMLKTDSKYHLKHTFLVSKMFNQIYSVNNNKNNNTMSITNKNVTDDDYSILDMPYDYEFAYEIGILAIPLTMRKDHNFQTVNVTYTGSECFGNSFVRALLPLGGVDTVILNSIIETIKDSGVLLSHYGDYYTWSTSDITLYRSVSEWISFKIGVFVLSLFSFFFLSTTTALLVRVLISSGVVLLFPMFWLLQLCGVNIFNSRLISLSYPWIGVPLEMLRSRHQSTTPFLISHLTRVIVYYSFYEACQISFGMWFYGVSRPGQREMWLYAIMMLWEYYSMIYVRATSSIIFFPRVSIALFLIYHFYLYSQPFGFHLLALLVMFMYLLALMIHCVRKYEIEVYYRGLVSIDQPRQLYNSLPWLSWTVALAPDYTIFMPVTQRSLSVYSMGTAPVDPNSNGLENPAGGDLRREVQEQNTFVATLQRQVTYITSLISSIISPRDSISTNQSNIAMSTMQQTTRSGTSYSRLEEGE